MANHQSILSLETLQLKSREIVVGHAPTTLDRVCRAAHSKAMQLAEEVARHEESVLHLLPLETLAEQINPLDDASVGRMQNPSGLREFDLTLACVMLGLKGPDPLISYNVLAGKQRRWPATRLASEFKDVVRIWLATAETHAAATFIERHRSVPDVRLVEHSGGIVGIDWSSINRVLAPPSLSALVGENLLQTYARDQGTALIAEFGEALDDRFGANPYPLAVLLLGAMPRGVHVLSIADAPELLRETQRAMKAAQNEKRRPITTGEDLTPVVVARLLAQCTGDFVESRRKFLDNLVNKARFDLQRVGPLLLHAQSDDGAEGYVVLTKTSAQLLLKQITAVLYLPHAKGSRGGALRASVDRFHDKLWELQLRRSFPNGVLDADGRWLEGSRYTCGIRKAKEFCGCPMPRHLGDIDLYVIDSVQRRVLVVECKFRKGLERYWQLGGEYAELGRGSKKLQNSEARATWVRENLAGMQHPITREPMDGWAVETAILSSRPLPSVVIAHGLLANYQVAGTERATAFLRGSSC